MAELPSFDGAGLIAVLDAKRSALELDWAQLADVLWDESHDLNAELDDDCLCSGALVRTARRGTMSCQYALVLLRWVGRAPEDFLTGPVVDVGDTALPVVGPDRRLRFDLRTCTPRWTGSVATAGSRGRHWGSWWGAPRGG